MNERWYIPDSWLWVSTDQIAEIVSGGTPSTKNLDNFTDQGIPWITPLDLSKYKDVYISKGARDITEKGLYSSSARLLPKNTVLFTSRAPIGYCAIAANELTTNQGFKNLVLYGNISPEFIRLYLISSKVYAESLASGTTFKELSAKRMTELKIPLPPLNEQKRIVAKIELIQECSQIVQKELERVKVLLKKFRRSLLASAFRGDLTKDWRANNPDIEPAEVLLERIKQERRSKWEQAELEKMRAKGITPKDDQWKKKYSEPQPIKNIDNLPSIPDGWCWVNIGEVENFIGSGITPKGGNKVYQSSGIPFIRSQNVYPNELRLNDVAYISTTMHHSMSRTHIKPQDILLNITGASIGRCANIPDNLIEANVNQHVCIIRVISLILPQYVSKFINSYYGQEQIFQIQTGMTRQGLNYEQVKSLVVPICSLTEQEEIVKKLEKMMKFADRVEEEVKLAEKKLNQFNQSVLAKAFRGELVPQDPNDEPASVLLEKIQQEKAKLTGKKTKK